MFAFAPFGFASAIVANLLSNAVRPSRDPARPPQTARANTAPVDPSPMASLPMLPRIARVRVEAARDRVVVVEEIDLPKGDWHTGGLELFAAFGAPGTPIAIDARLVSTSGPSGDPRKDDVGDPIALDPAVRRAKGATALLGRPQMAGVVLHLRESALRRAFESGRAAVRLRTLLHPPAENADGSRDLVVRLGMVSGQPLTLGRIQVVSLERDLRVTHASATLCGPEADPFPLSVTVLPRAESSEGVWPPSIPPEMAVRHPTDDLCVRFWVTS